MNFDISMNYTMIFSHTDNVKCSEGFDPSSARRVQVFRIEYNTRWG